MLAWISCEFALGLSGDAYAAPLLRAARAVQ
jgi:hypothetical protein